MGLWFIQGNENVFVSNNFLRDRRPSLFVIPPAPACRGSEAEGSAVSLSLTAEAEEENCRPRGFARSL
jgi:hypothetical protein